MTEKGQFIISHYLVLIGIIDPVVVIGHQADETKKTVDNSILGPQPTSLRRCVRTLPDNSSCPGPFAKIIKNNNGFKAFLC